MRSRTRLAADPRAKPPRRRRPDHDRAADTDFEVARCPLCHGPLAVRLGRCGPYFQCRCPARRRSG